MSVDVGLLIVRVLVGLVVAAHGGQKLFGWFGGPGLQGFGGWMGSMGLKPAPFWALLGALGEFGGGLLLALGLFTLFGSLATFGAMLMAIALVHWSKGFWSTQGGYEYPLVLLVAGLTPGLVGPGAYSLDALLGLALPAWLFWGGLVGVLLVVAYGLSLTRQQTAARQHTAS